MEEKKEKRTARVLRQEEIGTEIYSMWLEEEQIAKGARPGQFVNVYCRDGSRLLPRPISVCETKKEKGALRIVYRVAGKGTEEFSRLRAGDAVAVLGPLGNGFPLNVCEAGTGTADNIGTDTKTGTAGNGRKAFLIGGGIGIPPMLELAKRLSCEKEIVLGYRDNEIFLAEEFSPHGRVTIATEDGSAGVRGNVLDAIRENGLKADVLFACGPKPMLKAVKAFAAEAGVEAWLSLEERMACGVGACLGCVCKSKEIDEHTFVHNKRVCKDGPVFRAEEVEL